MIERLKLRRPKDIGTHRIRLAACGNRTVLMEVLAGVRNDQRATDRRLLLLRCELLAFTTAADFEGAAKIRRHSCSVGVRPARLSLRVGRQPRRHDHPAGIVDCMIAAIARLQKATMIAFDVDLNGWPALSASPWTRRHCGRRRRRWLSGHQARILAVSHSIAWPPAVRTGATFRRAVPPDGGSSRIVDRRKCGQQRR